MALGFILSISKKDSRRNISELIVGFSLLFLGLSLMKNSVPDLRQTPEVLSFIQGWQGYGFGSTLIFLALGVILTLVLQSSSATMALTLIMLNMGWIHFDMACAMVLGENIGTTITANIAAAVGNTSAKRAALAHTVFNVFGVVWALITFPWFLKLVGWITASIFGLPNPADEAFSIEVTHDAQGNAIQSDSQTAALYGLSMLHTCFNTINTALLIGFVPAIEKLVCAIIKGSKKATDNLYRLKYIEAGNMSTPELATEQAFNEIIHFARISHNGLGYIRSAIGANKKEDFEFYREKLVKYEEISDRIEYEIATFLNSVSTADISEITSMKIKSMYKIIGELESLGDSGEAISRMLSRRNSHNKSFTPETIAHIEQMIDAIHHAYEVMINNLSQAHAGTLLDISNALQTEEQINQLRNQLREAEIEDIEQNKTNYQTSVYYLDIVSELEKMGDFMINISQALERAFIK
jgi:phosphate:Na+ symporter